MRGRIGFSFLFALVSISIGPTATAGDCSGLYSPCINDDILWPHAGPSHFVSIGSAETLAQGHMGFGLVGSYLSRPIVLTIPSPGPPGTRTYTIDDQVNGTFLWSYGIAERLELDLALPVTFGQSGAGLAPVTGGDGLKDTALRDLRFGFAYAFVSPGFHAPKQSPSESLSRQGLGLLGRLEISAPSGDSGQFAGERSAVFVPSIAAEYRAGRSFAGIELGARVRPTTELVGARVGTQLVTAIGAGYDIVPHDVLTAALEAWAVPNLVEQHDFTLQPSGAALSSPNGKFIVPAEWQLSARTAPFRDGDFSIQVGGGGAIPLSSDAATTTPRFRFTLGVRWEPRARTSDARSPESAQP